MKRKILFITGTRADFGKQKTLMNAVQNHKDFELKIFCTGMHLMSKYGYTVEEIKKAGFSGNLFHFLNQVEGESMEMVLSNTIAGLSRYLHENPVDLIIVHGDRVETLAGAMVGALNNTLVGHIEGGEVSGTIDDLIRHATSKMSHLHFTASHTARNRLLQLGEKENSIFNIGSPDVDVMLSNSLPKLDEVRERYDIDFEDYAVAILHPVTTEIDKMKENAEKFVSAIKESDINFVIIYPNNDLGSEYIFEAYEKLRNNSNIKIFPSLRFEYFLTLLKNSLFIIGNSSAGIHEAPIYGVPTLDIGTRQNNRFVHESITHHSFDINELIMAMSKLRQKKRYPFTNHYGSGRSAENFIEILETTEIWNTRHQKRFIDINIK